MKLLVLDGNSLVNRAFYAIRMLSNSEGLPTNAIFGFMNIYLRLLDEEKPEGVCVAFDRPEPTFRRQKYDGYKAQRKGMPDELAMQMPYVKELLRLLGVHCYEMPGWEADDILGTMARICSEKGIDCTVVTGDRDSLQLVSDHTSVRYVTSKVSQGADIIYTPEVFKAEYGFEPIKLIDLKALMGDSSDNIPGVAGIGQKTAMDLVQRFGFVEDIYAKEELEN
ncbi:MAG: DNA polymerase I, partial [Oscillospiraceae bacterium]|nr:DNA polymerase I [Oscillospiraceae bacterium]